MAVNGNTVYVDKCIICPTIYVRMFCVICTCNILAYRMAVHSTAQCIQEDTHRCCCCWQCTSHRSHMGRLKWRVRGRVFED